MPLLAGATGLSAQAARVNSATRAVAPAKMGRAVGERMATPDGGCTIDRFRPAVKLYRSPHVRPMSQPPAEDRPQQDDDQKQRDDVAAVTHSPTTPPVAIISGCPEYQ